MHYEVLIVNLWVNATGFLVLLNKEADKTISHSHLKMPVQCIFELPQKYEELFNPFSKK